MAADLIVWKDEYATGIKTIDDQHQQLIRLINGLSISIAEGKTALAVEKTLPALNNYVLHHFSTEEELMAKHRYPETAAHKRQHTEFVDKVASMKGTSGDSDLIARQLVNYLRQWLLLHIVATDKATCAWLKEHGAK